MAQTDLVLTDACFSRSVEARYNLARVAAANRVFDLGVEKSRLSRMQNVAGLMGWFSSDMFLGLSFFCDLLHDMEENGGYPVDAEARVEARQLRDLGWPDMGQLIDDYFDFVAATPLDAARPTQEDSRIAGAAEVETVLESLRAEWCRVIAETVKIDVGSTYSAQHGCHFVPDEALYPLFVDAFGITIASQAGFEAYWIQRIRNSVVFRQTQEVQKRLGQDITGPLTDKLIGILSERSYQVEFAFWQQTLPDKNSPVGARLRGYICLQTSRGPIRILDRTPEASMQTHFPVEVQELAGVRRFNLEASSGSGGRKSGWVSEMLRGFAG